MNLKNIIKKGKMKIVAGAIGLSSIFSSGCDLEEYLRIAEAMGISDISDYSQLAGKEDAILHLARVNEGIHNYDFDQHRIQYQDRHWTSRDGWHSNVRLYESDPIRPGRYQPVNIRNRPVNVHVPRLSPGAFSSTVFGVWNFPAITTTIMESLDRTGLSNFSGGCGFSNPYCEF